jgi:hypothetical protein
VRKIELMTKGLIRGAIKTVAVIATAVLFLGRMTNHAELLVSVGPLVVLVGCSALWKFFEDGDVNTGYWPPSPKPSKHSTRIRPSTLPLRFAVLFASVTLFAWRWMLPPLVVGAAVALYLHFSRPQDSL